MNKRMGSILSLVLLTLSLLPSTAIYAETTKSSTVESTLSSLAEDPLKEIRKQTGNSATTEADNDRDQSSAKADKPQMTGETDKAASAANNSPKSTQATTLKEGNLGDSAPYDIDAKFAQALRTDATISHTHASWSGFGKAENTLTVDDMAALTSIEINQKALSSLKGIEYAVNLNVLKCYNNQLTELDVSNNRSLQELICYDNQLTSLDVTQNSVLKRLSVFKNQLTTLNVNGLTELEELSCYGNQLPSIDLSTNTNLRQLTCYNNLLPAIDVTHNKKLSYLNLRNNQLPVIDVSENLELEFLDTSKNQLPALDVTKNAQLTTLYTSDNSLPTLDISQNPELQYLVCDYNQLTSLDVRKNPKLIDLTCSVNQLTALDLSNNPKLIMLQSYSNKLTQLDTSNNPDLEVLYCDGNQLTELDVTKNTAMTILRCSANQLKELDVSKNTALESLECFANQISDITSMNGLTKLTKLKASSQKIRIPAPAVTDEKTMIDILKTTNHAGLKATNGYIGKEIIPYPTFLTDGDVIKMAGVTRLALINKSINFSYDGTQLGEGNSAGEKEFSGSIYFDAVSELDNQIEATPKKVHDGKKVAWKWTINSFLPKKAEEIKGTLDLPKGLTIIPESIKIDGIAATIEDINGTNSLGELDQDESKVISFETRAKGNIGDSLEIEARVDWIDDTVASPYFKIAKDSVQIQEEQIEEPKDGGIALLSAPTSFNYGVKKLQAKETSYTLNAEQYTDNKDVTTEGFYARMKDERTNSRGWRLTAQLSDFKDTDKNVMPNSSGAALRFDGVTIESVTNQDTPQETISTSTMGAPSKVKASESIVAGESPTTLVSAQDGEGKATWQLRIPFDKVSLNLPANAGKKGEKYQAKLTWSLDNTP
ncbi:WxL domain-containing protein [Candidatus Enterococcus murrayae]|uniref:WxL domain-containing protein n=1 Tax=Candidatus Enterococcus murrayae TaxID=2815321 RepID=A0ABS3HLS9_9ENTE|nr:WxL domain-containing protein [Enterococcus sp. MJM16]MBO0454268.1 WxL domain-containing protein [Enterococcus sp. MJM16]